MCYFFFFNDTATTEIYTLSLHDALPILRSFGGRGCGLSATLSAGVAVVLFFCSFAAEDRKSTRLNSSHTVISYAVFCLKKKKDTGELSASHMFDPSRAASQLLTSRLQGY